MFLMRLTFSESSEGTFPSTTSQRKIKIIVIALDHYSHGGIDYPVKGCRFQPTHGFLNDEGDIYEANIFFSKGPLCQAKSYQGMVMPTTGISPDGWCSPNMGERRRCSQVSYSPSSSNMPRGTQPGLCILAFASVEIVVHSRRVCSARSIGIKNN